MADEQTTRPTLDTVLERIQQLANDVKALRTEVVEGFRRMDAKFDVLNNHVLEIHAEERLLDHRVTALETKPS